MRKKIKSAVVMILGLALAEAVLAGCGESRKSPLETQQDNSQSIFQDSQQNTVAGETEGAGIETDEAEIERKETEKETDGADIETEETEKETEGAGIETDEAEIGTDRAEIETDGAEIETDGAGKEGQITEKYEDNFEVDSTTAKEFAVKVKDATENKDLEALSDLAAYPVYVGLPDVGVVETKEDFLKLGAETVFTEELLKSIKMADIENLLPSMAGFSISDGGTCNIIFGVVDGVLAIKGINY